MKHGLTLSLILAAALAAAPAMAQRSVSGTIGGQHAASAAATAAAPAAAPAAAEAPATTAVAATTAAPAASVAAEAPAAAAPVPATATATAPAGPLAMTIPTPQPAATSAGGGLLQTTFALMFVLALLVGLAWFLKRYGPKNLGGGRNVKLVGALSVGARERILVVEVGEQWIVVGASPGRMNALATMPRQEISEQDSTAALPTANFAAWLKQTIDKRNGK
ncbi:flagellar biosynthetic protein FliO [Duganella sp. S19_KUP01_CR8]|uniref:flagellar biosynthetic protein FliO n=1 Tax=Duganella sp. S19_KUP01_CR8 TaxID=3025502 RepID=UPI002FCD891A